MKPEEVTKQDINRAINHALSEPEAINWRKGINPYKTDHFHAQLKISCALIAGGFKGDLKELAYKASAIRSELEQFAIGFEGFRKQLEADGGDIYD
jgi:hypothetical protein